MDKNLYDSNKAYRTDLIAKWNVHKEQAFRLLKKAVSFQPIADIQAFITENVCDVPERLDIEAMQQNIREYKRQEKMARLQEEKLEQLGNIAQLFRNWQTASERLQIHRFLAAWAEKESLVCRIEEAKREKADCEQEISAVKERLRDLDDEIAHADSEKEQRIEERANSDEYQKINWLEAEQKQLQMAQKRLQEQIADTVEKIRRETRRLLEVCTGIEQWPELELLEPLRRAADDLAYTCSSLADFQPALFGGPIERIQQVRDQSKRFEDQLHRAAYALDDITKKLREELEENRSALEGLRQQKKDYPNELLDLRNQLQIGLFQKCGRQVPVEILADVLEIADGEELWRGAVEGYLGGQKFYLLVDPAVYPDAVSLYDAIKETYRKHSFGLVDVGKLREREHVEPLDNSLATKVQTDNPLARLYADYLLGRVVCCNRVEELRDHSIAITADGMLYQGYVVRPIPGERMRNAFLGRKAIELRIQFLSERKSALTDELSRFDPILGALNEQMKQDFVFHAEFVRQTEQRQRDYLRDLEIQEELQKLVETLSGINMFFLDNINAEIKALDERIRQLEAEERQCSKKLGGLETQVSELENRTIPEQHRLLREREDQLRETFTERYQESVGLPRYAQELDRLKQPAVVAKNFGNQVPKAESETSLTWNNLYEARQKYIQSFQPCPFRAGALDNDDFDRERRHLEEVELPRYVGRIREARESAMEQFQNDFLSKLRDSIQNVQGRVKDLNRALRMTWFGTERYEFKAERSPDYAEYYDMIMSPEWMGEGGLFAMQFQEKYSALMEELFSRITASDDTQMNYIQRTELRQNIDRYTDYCTYMKFDLEITDQNNKKQRLSQTLRIKSGGETQTPFYIAMLASFAQLYRVNDSSSLGNTVRLILLDEAFNKMDSKRITESVRLLHKLGLQAIICTPPDKVGNLMPGVDRTLVVCKDGHKMNVLRYSKEMKNAWSEK